MQSWGNLETIIFRLLDARLSSFLHGWQPVRKGTNGAVTQTGLLAAATAGSIIGMIFVTFGFFTAKCSKDADVKQLFVIPLSSLAGLCGSVIDSLLGATLQFSGFCTVRNKVCLVTYSGSAFHL